MLNFNMAWTLDLGSFAAKDLQSAPDLDQYRHQIAICDHLCSARPAKAAMAVLPSGMNI